MNNGICERSLVEKGKSHHQTSRRVLIWSLMIFYQYMSVTWSDSTICTPEPLVFRRCSCVDTPNSVNQSKNKLYPEAWYLKTFSKRIRAINSNEAECLYMTTINSLRGSIQSTTRATRGCNETPRKIKAGHSRANFSSNFGIYSTSLKQQPWWRFPEVTGSDEPSQKAFDAETALTSLISVIEMNVGIIASCLPACATLFRHKKFAIKGLSSLSLLRLWRMPKSSFSKATSEAELSEAKHSTMVHRGYTVESGQSTEARPDREGYLELGEPALGPRLGNANWETSMVKLIRNRLFVINPKNIFACTHLQP